jgi:hypothetical protein
MATVKTRRGTLFVKENFEGKNDEIIIIFQNREINV